MSDVEKKLGCNYQGVAFGANYEDGACIDGYLWDLDACDEDGNLYLGGDIPCPECNREEWIDYQRDGVEDDGFNAFESGGKEEDCPKKENCNTEFQRDWERFRDFWILGYRQAKIESIQAELTSLRSRLGWHYAPEVPEKDGRYVCELRILHAIGPNYGMIVGFNDGRWFSPYEVIRWAYLPADSDGKIGE